MFWLNEVQVTVTLLVSLKSDHETDHLLAEKQNQTSWVLPMQSKTKDYSGTD